MSQFRKIHTPPTEESSAILAAFQQLLVRRLAMKIIEQLTFSITGNSFYAHACTMHKPSCNSCKIVGQVAPPRKHFPNWSIFLLKNNTFLLLIGQTKFKRAKQRHSSKQVLHFCKLWLSIVFIVLSPPHPLLIFYGPCC